jgi:hypothetical protein
MPLDRNQQSTARYLRSASRGPARHASEGRGGWTFSGTAAAVACRADVIVTYNLKDFPRSALSEFHVEAQSPDEFLTDLLDLDSDVMLRILQEQANDLTSPPMTFDDLLTVLDKKLNLHGFTRAVRAYLAL